MAKTTKSRTCKECWMKTWGKKVKCIKTKYYNIKNKVEKKINIHKFYTITKGILTHIYTYIYFYIIAHVYTYDAQWLFLESNSLTFKLARIS